jgi:anti-sigma regulatory factor (Ser/Thr protein kinase)
MKSRLVIKSEIVSIERVYNWIESFLKGEVSAKILRDILLITQEMVTNAILHGNREIVEKEVIIEINTFVDTVVVTVTDEGEGIERLPLQEEAKELDYLAENGRGLKLAVLMTHKIELDGNSIKLIFKRR